MPFLSVYRREILSRLFSPTGLFVLSFAGVILAGGIPFGAQEPRLRGVIRLWRNPPKQQ